eukprot:13308-Prorocentrum_minimum.AAC.1
MPCVTEPKRRWLDRTRCESLHRGVGIGTSCVQICLPASTDCPRRRRGTVGGNTRDISPSGPAKRRVLSETGWRTLSETGWRTLSETHAPLVPRASSERRRRLAQGSRTRSATATVIRTNEGPRGSACTLNVLYSVYTSCVASSCFAPSRHFTPFFSA